MLAILTAPPGCVLASGVQLGLGIEWDHLPQGEGSYLRPDLVGGGDHLAQGYYWDWDAAPQQGANDLLVLPKHLCAGTASGSCGWAGLGWLGQPPETPSPLPPSAQWQEEG